MLQFKSLRLNGFKSFVDPVELSIKDGLTGIVGPNGCGKSNILEALRWVMGENKAKTMRGKEMNDVIFAGTQKRAAKAMAEVVLTLEDKKKTAHPSFENNDTLQISRKITRDLGSNYRMNGKEVRAKDFQLLFADAGTGSNSPSLVKQGQINELIQAKPKDRRIILEEAAGIAGIHSRRQEAETRLKAAEQNLERLDDLINAQSSSLKTLQKQAEKATYYRELTDNITFLQGCLHYIGYNTMLQEQNKAQENLNNTLDTLKTETLNFQNFEKNYDEFNIKVQHSKQECDIAATLVQQKTIAKNTLESQLQEAKNQIERYRKALYYKNNDIQHEQNILNDAKSSLERLQKDLTDFLQSAPDESSMNEEDLKTKIALQQDDLLITEKHIDQLRSQISDIQAKNRQLADAADKAKSERDQIEKTYLNLTLEIQKLNQELYNDNSMELAKEKVVQTQKAFDETIALNANIQQLRQQAIDDDSQKQTLLHQLEQDYKRLCIDIKSLQKIVDNPNNQDSLLQQVQVQSGYEKAFAAVFGDILQYNIDANNQKYWQDLGEYSLPHSLPNNTIPLSHFVSVPSILKRAISQIALINSQKIDANSIIKNLKQGQILVDLEGNVWRSDGFCIKAGVEDRAAIRLEQKNLLQSLIQQEKEHSQKLDSIKIEAQNTHNQRVSILSQENELREKIRYTEDDLALQKRKFLDIEHRITLKQNQLNDLQKREQALENSLNIARQTHENAEKLLENIENTTPLFTQIEQKRLDIDEKRQILTNMKADLETWKRRVKERDIRNQQLNRDLKEWQQRFDNAQKRLTDFEKQKIDLEAKLDSVTEIPKDLEQNLNTISKDLNQVQNRLTQAQTHLTTFENEMKYHFQQCRNIETHIQQAKEDKIRFETALLNYQEKEQDFIIKTQENLKYASENLTYKIQKYVDEQTPNYNELEQKLTTLHNKRDSIGAVNLIAEQEASQLKTELDTIMQEKNELVEAIYKLRQAITTINKEGRQKLLAAFEVVNYHFQSLFQHLFSGGHASLELVESNDPLEAGLEINAQPPGKKTKSLSLLSGGEQALTCLALIFAVFLTNPAPICVLDEVDAPLDDTNVERYCNLLHEMTRQTKTRFLVITHHVLTMSHMDRLYGVTMAEKGVSQLVSVDLQHASRELEVA